MNFIMIHNLVNPETGKTHKEENLERRHNIPLGTLVEVKFDNWFGDGACWKVHARLWVVAHTRDCDGTPLYSVSRWRDITGHARASYHIYHGFSEKSLTVVNVTDELALGYGALQWEDE